MKQQNLLKRIQRASLIFLLASSVALYSCASSSEAPIVEPDSPDLTEPADIPIPTDTPPVGDTALPATVETSVLQDIATTSNVPIASLQVSSSRPEAWPDGCLGLGGPDEICTFAIVDGWEVIASDGAQQWVYRTNSDGSVVRLADDAPVEG